MEDIYVIGHKNPDTDSVVSAIVYAGIKDYRPAVAGDINPETAFVLQKFAILAPEILNNISGKKVFLVDHNENTQMADGWENAEIVGVIDHHKINFSSSLPVFFHAGPVGATSSIIAKMYFGEVSGNPVFAGLLLSGILSDTVVFKSPTATEEDKDIALKLASAAGISDVQKFGMEVKKAGADISGRSVKDIVAADFKDFNMNGKRVGIGQVEVVAFTDIDGMAGDILSCLNAVKAEGYELVLFAATDIINEGSKVFFSGDPAVMEKAFGVKPEGNAIYVKGLISRKKQIVPSLEAVYKT